MNYDEELTYADESDGEDQLDHIASEIAELEEVFGVQLSPEACQEVADAALNEPDEAGDPDVASAFDNLVERYNEEVAAAEPDFEEEIEGSEDFAPENGEEIAAAIRGDFGPEAQAAAAEMVGVELVDEEGRGAAERVTGLLDSEVARLERELGRPVTKAEFGRIVNGLSLPEMNGLEQGELPDLVERHAKQFATHHENPDSRKKLMAEAANEVIAQKQAEEVPSGEDDSRQSRMAAAAEAAIEAQNGGAGLPVEEAGEDQ